jgi:hypothetical protein
MTPKETAKDLVDKYIPPTNSDWDLFDIDQAKECALIAVDEIMSEAKWWHDTTSYEESTDFEGGEKRLNYWHF